ncbi:uncharacterized protein VP01_134g4 [Puccinia sorghi]|uniref:Reverse transcriptase Ty1/copia-type domain-containing protein n=1 Tax=Puccinia sorghi TaxID=27349 RepID=A0A0L6VMD2_9BASI|nr:uncharacterized protein VP01_134g4 [Puccinia sorghi]
MEGIGFSVSFYDDSFYHLNRGSDTILVWIHVDDGIVTASSESVHSIVGIKVERPSSSKIVLSQPFLKQNIIDTFTTPKTLCRLIPLRETNSLTLTQPGEDVVNPNGYLSIVGSLNYLAVAMRPDLSFAPWGVTLWLLSLQGQGSDDTVTSLFCVAGSPWSPISLPSWSRFFFSPSLWGWLLWIEFTLVSSIDHGMLV